MVRKGQPTAPQPDPYQAPEYLASVDAKLAEILGPPDEDEGEPETPDPAAQAAPEPEEAPEAPTGEDEDEDEDQDEQPEGDEGEDSPEPEGDAAAKPERDRALNFLRLQGAPEDVLQGLSDEQAIAWWNSRKAAEAKTNRLIAELRAKAEPTADPSERVGAPTEGQPEPEPEALDSAWRAIEEDLGTEGRQALEKIVKPLQSQLVSLRQEREAMQARELERETMAARARVGERFPGLDDDAQWEPVREHMQALSTLPKYREIASSQGMSAALEVLAVDGARAAGMSERTPPSERQRNVAAARRASAPGPSTRTSLSEPPSDPKDRTDWILKMIHQGKKAHEIKALNGGKPW